MRASKLMMVLKSPKRIAIAVSEDTVTRLAYNLASNMTHVAETCHVIQHGEDEDLEENDD